MSSCCMQSIHAEEGSMYRSYACGIGNEYFVQTLIADSVRDCFSGSSRNQKDTPYENRQSRDVQPICMQTNRYNAAFLHPLQ